MVPLVVAGLVRLSYTERNKLNGGTMAQAKLALIDGHAVAYRAFHALRDANLRTSDGEPTYAVFGFLQIMLTTLQTLRPEYAAVSFDVGQTFRHEEFVDYKAGRA